MAIAGDKTVVVQGRLDIRKLARLNDYFVEIGARPNTTSELVRLAVDVGYIALLNAGRIQSHEAMAFHEAYNALRGYGNLHKAGQNERLLHKAMGEEEIAGRIIATGTSYDQLKTPKIAPISKGQEFIFKAGLEQRTLDDYEWDELTMAEQADVRARNPQLVPERIALEEPRELRVHPALARKDSQAGFTDFELGEFQKTTDRMMIKVKEENRRFTKIEWTFIHPTQHYLIPEELRPEGV